MSLTRFSVPPLHTVTRSLAAVAMGREEPDLVIRGGRVLSTYTERIHADREVWIKSGRIAAVKPAGTWKKQRGSQTKTFDAKGGIIAPGLVDPHIHIESSMMTACAYAEGALLNGTTTIFCDSHEIGNVCDAAGIEWMLKDARQAPLNIFLTVPSTVPATSAAFETAGGDLTADKIGQLFDKWPEAVALGEKMDFVQVAKRLIGKSRMIFSKTGWGFSFAADLRRRRGTRYPWRSRPSRNSGRIRNGCASARMTAMPMTCSSLAWTGSCGKR